MEEQLNETLSENRFGMAKPARMQTIEELTIDAQKHGNPTHRIANFQGNAADLSIIRVPIGLPKYRIGNGRTASAQQEWVTIHEQTETFFEQDPELYKLQEAQHKILADMVGEEGLNVKFKDANNKQVEPLLLDVEGFVVNGNRRLCCWRSLFYEKPESYPHFSHVDIVVLPRCDAKELDELEARLQIERDIRSDYSWHAEATMLMEKQKHFDYTTTELAKLYRKSKREIEELFEIRDLGEEYLSSINKKNLWSLLDETEHTFKKLNKSIKEQSSSADREILKGISFAYIKDPDAAGERLYTFIPKVGQHLHKVKENLKASFPEQTTSEQDGAADNPFGGPFGENDGSGEDMQLVAQIYSSDTELAKAQDIILDTIESEKSKAKEQDASNYLRDNLRKSQTSLTQAVNLGLTVDANVDGVNKQLDEIEICVSKIRSFLVTRAN